MHSNFRRINDREAESISITAHYIDVLGIRTFYETNEGGKDKTIVCIHSEGRETRQFHGVMEALSLEYNVIAFDMPAHGKTWPVDGKLPMSDWKEYVNFAWSFLNAMGLQTAILMGCGFGASVAYAIAQEHPVSGVISIGGADRSICEIDPEFVYTPYISTPHMVQEYNSSIIGRNAGKDAKELIHWQAWCETGITLKEDLLMEQELDMSEDMARIKCPVLMIRGEDDWVACQGISEKTLSHLGCNRKRLAVLPDTGRFAMLEQPELTAKEIRSFFCGNS